MLTADHTWTLPGLTLRDITLDAPLDHTRTDGPSIEVFARIAAAHGGEDRPFLVFLQGGPGSEAPRPTLDPLNPSWMKAALEHFRVVMLDQRGTGRSTPVGLDAPLPKGALAGGARTLRDADPADVADYLTHLRADAIVEDAELLRQALGAEQWSLLGQSFGGFTALRYLSAHADSLREVLMTGGIPAALADLDTVYTTSWQAMIARTAQFYARFPGDRDRMASLMDRAAQGDLQRADGTPVTPEMLRRLGLLLGGSGGAERLHYLLDLHPDSPAFQHDLAGLLPFSARNPLYAVIHESCWANGQATRWAADRTMPQQVKDDPTLLAGEHIHRSLFTDDPTFALWREAAELIAEHAWPALYDPDALRAADVPVAAAVYHDDVFVPREHSLATGSLLPRFRPWITSEYEHNGLRASGDGVFTHLLQLARGQRWA